MCLAVSNAANLTCVFDTDNDDIYGCNGVITTTKSDYFVDALDGNHTDGYMNENVTRVTFDGISLVVLPRKLNEWFFNFDHLDLFNIVNFPNFHRSQFYDFMGLTRFAAKNLPRVSVIPRSSFWDLTELEVLVLSDMPNLKNLHQDLLLSARKLRWFKVLESPKVRTIPSGLFRNQGDSLELLSFEGCGLTTVSYSAFLGLRRLKFADFENAGCLSKQYGIINTATTLTDDIRQGCKDDTRVAESSDRNGIRKDESSSSSSDSSDSSDY